uniref:Uncharacterized protein n=1 Tax=Graphocephala atropunctata TaxID=36148 RepID=A0A1B6KLE9_9HEMI
MRTTRHNFPAYPSCCLREAERYFPAYQLLRSNDFKKYPNPRPRRDPATTTITPGTPPQARRGPPPPGPPGTSSTRPPSGGTRARTPPRSQTGYSTGSRTDRPARRPDIGLTDTTEFGVIDSLIRLNDNSLPSRVSLSSPKIYSTTGKELT